VVEKTTTLDKQISREPYAVVRKVLQDDYHDYNALLLALTNRAIVVQPSTV
jgi:hypothetical protein